MATDAVIAAGTSGSVDMFASDSTDLVIDVNGYFSEAGGLEYFPITPCRVVDTRQGLAPPDIGMLFGPPNLPADSTRSFPLPQGRCSIPSSAQAYYVNFTVVPTGPLGYLTAYPSGQTRPYTSTLNSWDGRVLANGAIVPAGSNAGIDVYTTNETQLIVDVAGYFAPGNGVGQLFNAILPCRAATLAMQGVDQSTQVAGMCGMPVSAAGFAMNVTASVNQPLGYLTVWPAAQPWPLVSLLNAPDGVPGSKVGNGPIVSAGPNGQVSIRATDPATVTLDLTGYFAAQAPPQQGCLLVLDQPFTPTISRTNGNRVSGNAGLRVSQTPQGTWSLTVTTIIQFRSPGSNTWQNAQTASAAQIQVTPATPFGATYGAPANADLQPRGDGEYRVAVTANGTCGGNGYNLTPNNPSTSPALAVFRPRITGPAGSPSPFGIWWLGGGTDDANGYYNRATFAANANGNPGSPNWSVPQGSDKVSLSCTNCTFPLVTSRAPSANCQYDVALQVNYDGFYSDPYWLNVNAPFYMQSGGLSTTLNELDGWLTLIPYVNRDRCQYPMPSIALNETFGEFTTSLWEKPVAEGVAVYDGTMWWDQISIFGCTACVPPSQQNNPPGQVIVDQAQQFWRIGSSTVGLGIYVQQNRFRRYTGHGEHLDLLRILF